MDDAPGRRCLPGHPLHRVHRLQYRPGGPGANGATCQAWNGATCQAWNGATWNFLWPQNFSGGVANNVSMALDPAYRPVVGDADTGGLASVKRWNRGAWSSVGASAFTAQPVSTLRIAVNPAGEPLFACDIASGGLPNVMAYR